MSGSTSYLIPPKSLHSNGLDKFKYTQALELIVAAPSELPLTLLANIIEITDAELLADELKETVFLVFNEKNEISVASGTLLKDIFYGDTEEDLNLRINRSRVIIGEYLWSQYLQFGSSEFKFYIYYWLLELLPFTRAWEATSENTEQLIAYANLISFTGQHNKTVIIHERVIEIFRQLQSKTESNAEKILVPDLQ